VLPIIVPWDALKPGDSFNSAKFAGCANADVAIVDVIKVKSHTN
jgi:hypothetical protein